MKIGIQKIKKFLALSRSGEMYKILNIILGLNIKMFNLNEMLNGEYICCHLAFWSHKLCFPSLPYLPTPLLLIPHAFIDPLNRPIDHFGNSCSKICLSTTTTTTTTTLYHIDIMQRLTTFARVRKINLSSF